MLEYDEVYIADDLNNAVKMVQISMASKNITYDQLTKEEQTELNLYYVACTRAHKVLLNAVQLEYHYVEPKIQLRTELGNIDYLNNSNLHCNN